MPDFFATRVARPPPAADDDAQHDGDGDDAHDTTLDITFDVPDPTPDRSRSQRERSDASPAEAFAGIYADDDQDAGHRPGAAADGSSDAPDNVSGTSDDASDAPSDPPPGGEPGRRGDPSSAPQRGDDNDVSEFLRELSRLSLDPPATETSDRPKPPKPEPPAPSPGQDSGKKKRRGLFGRG